jgi:hypothetical protein
VSRALANEVSLRQGISETTMQRLTMIRYIFVTPKCIQCCCVAKKPLSMTANK